MGWVAGHNLDFQAWESGLHPAALESPSQGQWVAIRPQLVGKYVPSVHPFNVSRIDRTSYIVCSGHQWKNEGLSGMCAWWLPGRDKRHRAPYHGLGVMMAHLHVALPATTWSKGGRRDSLNLLPPTCQKSDSGLHPQSVLQMWQLKACRGLRTTSSH